MGMVVCYLFVYLAEAAIAKVYYAKVMEPKVDNGQAWMTLLAGYLLIFLCSGIGSPWINFIGFFLVNIILIWLLYVVNLLGAMFHSIVLTITMLVMELLTEYVFGLLFGGFLIFMEQLWTFAVESMFIKIVYYFATQVLALIFRKRRITTLSLEISNIMIILISLCSFWILATLILICTMLPIHDRTWALVISSIILILVIHVILVWVVYYNQKKIQDYGQMQLQLQKETDNTLYYQMLYEQDENQKTLLHDMKQHIYTMHDMCEQKDYEDLEKYMTQLLDKPEFQERVYICDHHMLNLILNRYRQQIEKMGIVFYTDIRSGCVDFMREADVTALFCNLLDNAVEGAKGCEDAFIELSIVGSRSGDVTVISMKNTCNRAPRGSLKKGFISYKKDSKLHGYGMKSVSKTVERYDGSIQTDYHSKEHIFETQIMVMRIYKGK